MQPTGQRIETLDYLRGLLALTVMIYHVLSWMNVSFAYPFNDLIERLGVYSVESFYIISGASLFIVYAKRKLDRRFLKEFAVKRYFRIAPLFYVATTLGLIINLINTHIMPGVYTLIVNYLLLFGWVSPTSYIATGGWSIGNEFVFYSLFPLLLFTFQKSKWWFFFLPLAAVGFTAYISFYELHRSVSLDDQWGTYISPFNQMYLFAGGMLVGAFILKYAKSYSAKRPLLIALLSALVLLFTFYPTVDNRISIVFGMNRLLFSLIMFLICFLVGTWGTTRENLANKVLKFLGATSYSIYLMHPVVYSAIIFLLRKLSIPDRGPLVLLLSIGGTIITSAVTYRFIEQWFMKKGKTLFAAKPQTPFVPAGEAY